MAKPRKSAVVASDPIIVIEESAPLIDVSASSAPADSAPTPPADSTPPESDDAPPADSAKPADDAPADSAPTPPPAPPCVAIAPKVKDTPKHESKLSKKAQEACKPLFSSLGDALTFTSAQLCEWGEFVADVLHAERLSRDEWDKSKFDATLREVKTDFAALRPNAQGDARPFDYWRFREFQTHATKLGIVGADELSYRRVVNVLAPACLDVVKDTNATTMKLGWAEWLKVVVRRLNATGKDKLNDATLVASVVAQAEGLYKSDPKRYPKPPKAKDAKPAESSTTATSTTATSTTAPTPGTTATSTTATSTTAPTPGTTATGTTAPLTPSESAKSNPADSAPTPASAINIESFAKGISPETAKQLGDALASLGSDDAVSAMYKAIVGRVKEMRVAKDAKKLAVGA